MATIHRVTGMSCDGCARAVSNAVKARVATATVEVDLDSGIVTVDGVDDSAVVKAAVERAGFEYGGTVSP